jgi:SAM-dependent methyltransferase
MTPKLTDRARLAANRARVCPGPALALHEAVRDEIEERLQAVNKTFTAPAVVTPFAEVWRGAFAEARVVADDEVLDLDPGAHDLVIHAVALHWADDPVGQLVQCRHALKPDGLFLGATPGGRTLHELRSVLAETESRLRGGIAPRVAPMAEIRDLGALLQRAGFALPVADAETTRVTYASARHLMRDLRAMGETNALHARDRKPLTPAFFDAVDRLYSSHFGTEDGRVTATLEMIYLAGWAPAESQPKPLRPGSAARRLADALRTEEHSADEPAGPRRD